MPTIKELFPWKLKLSEEELDFLWQNATIVFDANILIDFFQFSLKSSEEYLKSLQKIKDRLWIPHQVASEFLENYKNAVAKEVTAFEGALSTIDKWEQEQDGLKPLKDKLQDTHRMNVNKLDQIFKPVETIGTEKIKELVKIVRDKVLEFQKECVQKEEDVQRILKMIFELIDSNVGEAYDDEKLKIIYSEGVTRYLVNTPPGFKDQNKADKPGNKQYGDLVLWKQILDYSRASKKSIIFVTQDSKEDWWYRQKGSFEPLEELRQEFHNEAAQLFWMYRWDSFLSAAKERKIIEISSDSIKEAVNVSDFDNADSINRISNEYENQIKFIPTSENLFLSLIMKDKIINIPSRIALGNLKVYTKMLLSSIFTLEQAMSSIPNLKSSAFIDDYKRFLETLEQETYSLMNKLNNFNENTSLDQLNNARSSYDEIKNRVDILAATISPFIPTRLLPQINDELIE
jgi:predicted nucleic acid-binding protein